MCSEHFKPEEIQKTFSGKKRVKKQVVPSIFARTKPKQERPENLYQRRKRLRFDTEAPLSREMKVSDESDGSGSPEPSKEDLHKLIAELEGKIAVLSLEKFGLERFSSNPEQIQFYTGFSSYELLTSIFSWLEPYAKNMTTWSQVQRSSSRTVDFKGKPGDPSTKCNLPLIDQFFLFLVRVKQGFPIEDLAVRFKVSPSTVSRVFFNMGYFSLLYVWSSTHLAHKGYVKGQLA